MAFACFELDLALEVDIACAEDTLVDVGVHCTNGHIQFGVIAQYLIG